VVGIGIHYHGDGFELEEENWKGEMRRKKFEREKRVFLFVKKRVGEFWL
jgi:hypothetical protein